mmetsp:Transcript_15458/g.39985  ORF Transcript_15458/g.39985 Transcript_15458/m.39985 type:complete len:131 (-) Transcript_15458:360-752(-)
MGSSNSKPRTAKPFGSQVVDSKRQDGVVKAKSGSPGSKFAGKATGARAGMAGLRPTSASTKSNKGGRGEESPAKSTAGTKKMSRKTSGASLASDGGTDDRKTVFNDSAIEIKGLANTELREEDKATAMMF